MTQDERKPKRRTLTQNASIHLYIDMVVRELENGGRTMQDVCKAITRVEIRPTKENVKTIIWHEIQKALFNKEHSSELNTDEVNKVYEVMAQFLAREFEISLPFPSEEQTKEYLTSFNK